MSIAFFILHAIALQISAVFLDKFADSSTTIGKVEGVVALMLPVVGLAVSVIWFLYKKSGKPYGVASWSALIALIFWIALLVA